MKTALRCVSLCLACLLLLTAFPAWAGTLGTPVLTCGAGTENPSFAQGKAKAVKVSVAISALTIPGKKEEKVPSVVSLVVYKKNSSLLSYEKTTQKESDTLNFTIPKADLNALQGGLYTVVAEFAGNELNEAAEKCDMGTITIAKPQSSLALDGAPLDIGMVVRAGAYAEGTLTARVTPRLFALDGGELTLRCLTDAGVTLLEETFSQNDDALTLTLSPEALDKLPVGTHTVTAQVESGDDPQTAACTVGTVHVRAKAAPALSVTPERTELTRTQGGFTDPAEFRIELSGAALPDALPTVTARVLLEKDGEALPALVLPLGADPLPFALTAEQLNRLSPGAYRFSVVSDANALNDAAGTVHFATITVEATPTPTPTPTTKPTPTPPSRTARTAPPAYFPDPTDPPAPPPPPAPVAVTPAQHAFANGKSLLIVTDLPSVAYQWYKFNPATGKYDPITDASNAMYMTSIGETGQFRLIVTPKNGAAPATRDFSVTSAAKPSDSPNNTLPSTGTRRMRVKVNTSLNVRSAPGGKKTGKLTNNAPVTVDFARSVGEWFYITYTKGGKTYSGVVAARYID